MGAPTPPQLPHLHVMPKTALPPVPIPHGVYVYRRHGGANVKSEALNSMYMYWVPTSPKLGNSGLEL